MTDLTATASLSGIADFHYDDARGLLYLTTSNGLFEVFNPLTGALIASLNIGGLPGRFALTPDGKYAIVGGVQAVDANTDAVDRIDLSTLTDQHLTLSMPAATAGGIGNIAIDQSGVAVFSSAYNYWDPQRLIARFNPEAASLQAFPLVGETYSESDSFVASSPGTDDVFIKEDQALSGQMELVNPITGAVAYQSYTSGDDPYAHAGNPSGPNNAKDAISAQAGLIVDVANSNVRVYDFNLWQVADLTPKISGAWGAQFSADGHQLFLWAENGQSIFVYDTKLWTQVGVLPLGTLPPAALFGQMVASADGRFLFLATGSGIEAIDLSARLQLTVSGDATNHLLYGSVGSDTIISGPGDDFMDGEGGINTASYISATSGVTVSLALEGAAQDTVGAGRDTLNNFQNLMGSAFADHLTGDANDNVIDGGGGDDTLDGAGGVNTVSYASATVGVAVSLALQGSAQNTGAGIDTLTNFQNLTGSAFNDTLSGDGNNNVLDGGGGVNTVSYASATSGVTVSLGLQGQAQNTGGAGADTLSNFQNLTGSAFNDTLTGDAGNNVIDGGAGNDTLDGGGGINIASYASATTGVTVSLALQGSAQDTVGAGRDTLNNFQNLLGSAFADHLTGDAHDNVIDGNGGNDTLDGGGGVNTVTYASATSGVTVSLALQGSAQDTLGAGVDTLSNFQNLTGSAFNDTLAGDSGNNILDGGRGVNTVSYASATSGVTVSLGLQGMAQNTIGAGTDTLSNFQNIIGSAFNDTLTGGSGANVLTGGGGADIFMFNPGAGVEVVTDFSDAQRDRINLAPFSNLHTLADVLALAAQSGPNTVIALPGGGSVTLDNVAKSALTGADFLLATEPPHLHINVTYDASAANAPAGFTQAVNAAVQFFESTITSNITVKSISAGARSRVRPWIPALWGRAAPTSMRATPMVRWCRL